MPTLDYIVHDNVFLALLIVNHVGRKLTDALADGGHMVYIGPNEQKGMVFWDDDYLLINEAITRGLWVQGWVFDGEIYEHGLRHEGSSKWWNTHIQELEDGIRCLEDLK